MKRIYYGEPEEEKLLNWLASDKLDNTIYLTQVYPILRDMARFIRYKYAKYEPNCETLVEELVSHTSQRMITDFDSSRGTIYNFIYNIMQQHIYLLYKIDNCIKRGRNITWLSLDAEAEDNDNNALRNRLFREEYYNLYMDSEFIAYVIDYWRNYNFHKSNKMKAYVHTIINILGSPSDYPTSNGSYMRYFCKLHGVTRQQYHLIIQFMKLNGSQLKDKWERGQPIKYELPTR